MNIRRLGWVLSCVLVLAMSACDRDQPAPAEQPAAEKMEKAAEAVAPAAPQIPGLKPDMVFVTPGIDKVWPGLKSLAQQIQSDFEELEKLFAGGNMRGIASMLDARHAVVAGINYELMYGKDSAPFWGIYRAGGAFLATRVISVYVSNEPGPHLRLPLSKEEKFNVLPGKMLFDAYAVIVVELRFTPKTGIGTVHYLNWEYGHQWCCEWGPDAVCPPPIEGVIGQ